MPVSSKSTKIYPSGSCIQKFADPGFLLALLAVVIGIGTVVARYGKPIAEGSDASGYIHNSRLIMEGRLYSEVRPIGDLPIENINLGAYQPLGFLLERDTQRLKPQYPFGPSIFFAAFRLISDDTIGILLALIFIGCSTPIGVYLLSRELGLERNWSALAACILGLSPLFLYRSMLAASDALSACLATYCVTLALVAHRRSLFAALLGICFSLVLFTRLPNAMIALPVGLALLSRIRQQVWWWVIILSSLPGIALLLWINNELYGSPFASGYGNVWRFFKAEYFGMTMRHFAYWLTALHTPVVTLGFLASLLLFRKHPITLVILWIWSGSFILFYAFYYHSHLTWWYLRFILPAVPALVIGAVFLMRSVSYYIGQSTRRAWLPTALCAGLALYICFSEKAAYKGNIYFDGRERNSYLMLNQWMEENTKPEDVFLSMQTSGAIYYYTNQAIIRYDLLRVGDWDIIRNYMKGYEGNLYAAVFPFEIEKKEVFSKHTPGEWVDVEKFVHMSVLRLEP
jgi:hypothetical protein